MGLSYEQKTERANATRNLQTFSPQDGKPYFFINYKSDDWKIVLDEIVRKLINDYGLRVYYDKNFELNNDSWIKNMNEALSSKCCKGIISFISKSYLSSYACGMELLFSQSDFVWAKHNGKSLPVIPILIESRGLLDIAEKVEEHKFKNDMKDNEWDLFKNILESYVKNPSKDQVSVNKQISYLIKSGDNVDTYLLAHTLAAILDTKNQRNYAREQFDWFDNVIKAIREENADVIDESLIGKCPSNNNTGIIKQMNDVEAKKHLNNELYNDKNIEPSSEFYEKIGAFVKENIPKLFEQYTFSEEEITMLLDKEYSRKTFGLSFPFLSKEKIITKVKDRDIPRCYKDPIKINGKDYYLTSQWLSSQFEPLKEWIMTTKKNKSSSTT